MRDKNLLFAKQGIKIILIFQYYPSSDTITTCFARIRYVNSSQDKNQAKNYSDIRQKFARALFYLWAGGATESQGH